MLKPALARGELRCVGATTLDEYRQYIEKDAALERRFQKVIVDEPSVEDTIAILRGLKRQICQTHHGVQNFQTLQLLLRQKCRTVTSQTVSCQTKPLI